MQDKQIATLDKAYNDLSEQYTAIKTENSSLKTLVLNLAKTVGFEVGGYAAAAPSPPSAQATPPISRTPLPTTPLLSPAGPLRRSLSENDLSRIPTGTTSPATNGTASHKANNKPPKAILI